MSTNHTIVRYIAFIGLIISLSTVVSAQSVVSTEYGDGFEKICYDNGKCSVSNHLTYLRWDGQYIPVESLNIDTGQWTYLIQDNPSDYTLYRLDDRLTLPKNLGNYHFGLNKISFDFIVTPAQLNTRSTQVGSNWYIEIPESLLKTRFLWDDKKPTITNNVGSTLNETDYWYVRYNSKYYLGYNQAARTWGASSTTITFSFNSWSVGEGGNAWSGNSSYNNFMLDRNTNHIILPNSVTDGLVLYHKMSGSSGITSYDMNLTLNNNGILTNMNTGLNNGSSGWNSSGKFGNALSFDGVNDYVNVSNSESLNITSPITFEVWLKTTSANQMYLFEAYDITSPYSGYGVWINNGLIGYWGGYGAVAWKQSTFTVNDGLWHHVAVTVSGTIVSFYKDGVLETPQTGQQPTSYSGNRYIGARIDGLVLFNGLIDEVRIYNRALTNDEINQTMNNTMSTFDTLTTWYNASTGNETYQIDINATFQTNSNYSAFYRTNGTGAWTAIGTPNSTGNQSIALSPRYQNTDLKVELYGNGTATSDLITTTFWSQYNLEAIVNDQSFWDYENSSVIFTVNNSDDCYGYLNGTTINSCTSPHNFGFETSGIYVYFLNTTVIGSGQWYNTTATITVNSNINTQWNSYTNNSNTSFNNTPVNMQITYRVDLYNETNVTYLWYKDSVLTNGTDKTNLIIINTFGAHTIEVVATMSNGVHWHTTWSVGVLDRWAAIYAKLNELPTKDDVTNSGNIGFVGGFVGGIIGGMIVIGYFKRRRT